MAYNVISCRKTAENTQILKIAKFPTPNIIKKKTKKNGSLNRDLLKFLNRYEREKKSPL